MMVSLRQYGDQSVRVRIQQALRPAIVRRGLSFALIVGTLVTAINQGDVLAGSEITPGVLSKILLNYCIPYFVLTYADLEVFASQQREWDRTN